MEDQKKEVLALAVIQRNMRINEMNPFASELDALKTIEFKLDDLKQSIKNNTSGKSEIALELASLCASFTTKFTNL